MSTNWMSKGNCADRPPSEFFPSDGVGVDRARKVVSTPAYMTAARITEVRDGVKAMVDEVLALMP